MHSWAPGNPGRFPFPNFTKISHFKNKNILGMGHGHFPKLLTGDGDMPSPHLQRLGASNLHWELLAPPLLAMTERARQIHDCLAGYTRVCTVPSLVVTQQPLREREKFINHKQINNVTIKIINSYGRLPARKIPSSWPPMQIQIILFYM